MELFEYLTRHANDIILITDEHGQIIEANERAIITYGYLHEELLQMNIEKLRDSKKSPPYESVHQKVLLENGYIYEAWHMRRNGTSFPVESSIRQIQVHDKFIYQVIVRDITRRKCAEEALRESEERLRLAQKATNDVIWDWDILIVTDLGVRGGLFKECKSCAFAFFSRTHALRGTQPCTTAGAKGLPGTCRGNFNYCCFRMHSHAECGKEGNTIFPWLHELNDL